MKLVNNEVRLEMALDFCELGIYEHYVPAHREMYCNKWCQSLLALPSNEIVDPDLIVQRLTYQIHPDDRNNVRDNYLAFLSGKTSIYETEGRLRVNSGIWKYISAVAKAIDRDASGRPTHVLGVIKDITRFKQAELDRCKYTRQLQELSSELGLAEEKERRRIAVGMHDTAIQDLALAQVKLGQLEQQVPDDKQRVAVREIRASIDHAIQATRTMVFELSPPVLYELGLKAALSWLCDTLYTKYGVKFHFEAHEMDKTLPDNQKVFLFQATRELALNVCQHASVSEATIRLSMTHRDTVITVEDRGQGFDMHGARNQSRDKSKFGLFSIRERTELLQGEITIDSTPGHGTRVNLRLPRDESNRT